MVWVFIPAQSNKTVMKDTCRLAMVVRGLIPTLDAVDEFVREIVMNVTSIEADTLEVIIK